MNTNETGFSLSKDYLSDSLYVWNHASITLIDIRHFIINPDEKLTDYLMPASGFIFTIANNAQIFLDDISYRLERFGLYHGGKGTMLSIHPIEGWLEYYLLFYKPDKNSQNRELTRLLKFKNPFIVQYGFIPNNPLFFVERFTQMYERWSAPTPLNLFYGKTIFYQLVFEIYEELEQNNIQIQEPDIVSVAKRYMDKHYNETIVITQMCDRLGISYSHFHRLFKAQLKQSPQKYLIAIRLFAARKYLRNSNASLREISEYCGFPDQYNFHRLFVKNIGMTPIAYREKSSIDMRDYDIDNMIYFPYNEKETVRHNKLKVDGGNFMYKDMKNKALVAAALSLMLLLSACNSTTSTNSAQSVTTTQTQEANVSDQESTETKTISTVMGDVKVPVNPQRIGVWVYEQELYSLGVTPISISGGSYSSVWPDLPSFSYAPDKEELMSLEPDLLITYDDENFYNEYKDIAPVITIPLSSSAEDTLRFLGEVLNISDKAEQFIQNFNEKAKDSKKQITEAGLLGKTVALIEPISDQIWMYDNSYGRGGNLLYDYLGFELTDSLKDELGDNHYLNISYEVLPEYCDADYIVVVKGEGYESLKENAVWQSLKAVQANHVIEFDTTELEGRGLDEKTLTYFTESFVGTTTKE